MTHRHRPKPLPWAVRRLASNGKMPRVRNPDSCRIVAAVANHAIWPMPWPSTFTLEWRNRIDPRQCFLRVVSIGPGQAHRERDAVSIANQMTLAPSLGAIRRIWTGLRTAVHRADRAAVNNCSGPIDVAFAGEPIQEREVHQIQTPSACQSRRRRQHVMPEPQPSS